MDQANAPSSAKYGFIDPLLDCLLIVAKFYGRSFSGDALIAGLPLEKNKLTPRLFIRAAERANLSARIVIRNLNKIPQMILPAVLMLNNGQACILQKINDDLTAELTTPESGEGVIKTTLTDLQESYAGYAIFIQPVYKFDNRADEFKLEKPKSWFWSTLWRFRASYYQVMIAALFINLFTIASTLFTMNVYDRVIPNNAYETLWVLATGISIVFIFDFFLRTLRAYLIDISGKKSDNLLASMIFQQVLNLRLEVKPKSAGGFANNLHAYEGLRDFFTSATIVALIDLPFVLLFLIVIFFVGGWLVLIPLLAFPIVIGAGLWLEVPTQRAVQRTVFGNNQKQALLIESLNNLETIKTQMGESRIQHKWEHFVSMVSAASLKARFYSTMAINITNYVMQMVTVGTIIVGVYLIADGSITMGALIASNMLAGRALAPLSQIVGLITRYQQSKLGLNSMNKIMELPVERADNMNFFHRPEIKGEIEFRNVSFVYPQQKIAALNNINIKISPGEKIGIIGRIGSGKSTLLKLLLSLYKSSKGNIRIDGIDLEQIDPTDLRRSVGFVGQESALFYGTVRDNITITMPWATDESILKAAQLAGVDRFVKLHPSGYDMQIGEGGDGLSGGQRQTIAVARALLTDAPLLLFDEPTSSMDNSTEQEFIKNISSIAQNKTILLVTHKPQMLALVNRLIIIDNGQVVADGPKEIVLTALSQNKVQAGNN